MRFENDGFCIINDGFCINDNEFCKGQPDYSDPQLVGSTKNHALSLDASRQAMTLLYNPRSTLPLTPGKRVAVIGANAETKTLMAGGTGGGLLSAQVLHDLMFKMMIFALQMMEFVFQNDDFGAPRLSARALRAALIGAALHRRSMRSQPRTTRRVGALLSPEARALMVIRM